MCATLEKTKYRDSEGSVVSGAGGGQGIGGEQGILGQRTPLYGITGMHVIMYLSKPIQL